MFRVAICQDGGTDGTDGSSGSAIPPADSIHPSYLPPGMYESGGGRFLNSI